MPRFEASFSKHNVECVVKTLNRLQYHGPIGLAWDDTDLEKALSVWQVSRDSWSILGAANGVLKFNTLDEVDAAFEDGSIEKADKVFFNHFQQSFF